MCGTGVVWDLVSTEDMFLFHPRVDGWVGDSRVL